MTSPLRAWLLFAALFLPLVAAEAPVEAQRSSVARRARVRNAQATRARRARAVRARQARAARAQRARGQRLSGRRAPAEELDASPTGEADMDFVQEGLEREAPPPMQLDDIADIEARQLDRRRAALDPELFATAGGADDGEDIENPRVQTPSEPGQFSPLRVRAFVRAFNRGLVYSDPSRGPISDYGLPVGAAAGFGLEYYPAAHVANDALAHIGVQAEFHHSFLVESNGPNDIMYPTTELAWHVGLRYRIPLDDAGSQFAPELGAGHQRFRVERGGLDNASPGGVPFVDYSYLRAGVAFRANAGDFVLGGHVAYLPSFDLGAIGTELGGGFGHGVSASVVFLYPIDLGFSFMAELDARVFILDFDTSTTSRSAAGGATDHYIGLNVGVEWDLPSAARL